MFPLIFIIGMLALWTPIKAFHVEDFLKRFSDSKHEVLVDYSAKYIDCISLDSFSSRNTMKKTQRNVDFDKVNASLQKYEQSLASNLKNLNNIDAHDFLHHEFLKSQDTILNHKLSELQLYYHSEIMRICFEKDRALNLGSGQTHL